MMAVSRLMLVAAAMSLACAPVAVQAGTRAGDNGSVYTVSGAGLGRSADGESIVSGGILILALFASAATISSMVFLAGADDNGQSPGT